MINSIELVNWKTHGSTKLSFAKGTNILIGQMGAGKSSVMDAISFGLFGTFPSIKNRRVGVTDLIRNRPEQKKSAKIRLSFKAGEDTYLVEREIYLDGSSKASLEKNGKHLQSQPQRVTEEIEKALSVDYDLFSRAIYSEQNRLDYFLELRAADRKKQIDNLLGLDKFANALENGTSLLKKIKDSIEESEKTAEVFDIEGQKKQFSALEEEKERLSNENNVILKSIDELKDRAKKVEAGLKGMKEQYNKKISLTKEIAELQSKLETLGKEVKKIDLEKLGELSEVNKELKSAETELEKFKSLSKAMLSEMQAVQTRLGKAESQAATVEKDILERERLKESMKGRNRKKSEEELNKHKSEIEKLEGELAYSTAQLDESNKWIKELEKHISKCPVCERDLDSEMKNTLLMAKKALTKELEGKTKDVRDLHKKKKLEMEELNILINKLTVIEDKLKGYSDLEERKKASEKELEEAKEESSKAKAELEKINNVLNKTNESASRLKAAKENLERRLSYVEEKEKIEQKATIKEEELKNIGIDEKKLDATQKEFTLISSELGRCGASLAASKKSMEEKSKQIEEKKVEIEKIEKIYGEIDKRKVIVDNLIRFNNSLQETQTQLRSRLVSSINSIMEQIWPELYPYEDYTDLELSATDGDYVLRVKTFREGEERWEEVETIASGGERSIACLAMRVAFAMVLVPNLRWLILDEPTHNIDQLGLQRFVRVFNEKLPEIVDQIFIITHDEALKQVSNGRIYVLGRNKAIGEESSVEEL